MPHIVALRALTDNYIWVIRDHCHAAVVDPGDASPVLDYLQRENLELIAILNTHHHPDHVGGNAALLREFTVPVYGPANESIPTLTHRVKECRDHESEEGNAYLPEFSLTLRVLDIPGHTAGHIAYYGANLLFCGDTLFACGCGRLFEGTAQQMLDSLQKLADLPNETRIYCGHEYTLNNIRFARNVEPGNQALIEREAVVRKLREQNVPTLPSTIAMEKATNPFLRCNEPEIIRSAGSRAGKPLSDPVSVFAAIRDWKDHF
ncbi:MAG: hydroxyacylglutathione hydrolase [Nitrosospira sp.]|nr:hydroxyacylglutathione hydrolase [Nitrosospira sp.]MDN5935693.1 hydroxyacylglutathione hydrolase [Nitrosospira sp.]